MAFSDTPALPIAIAANSSVGASISSLTTVASGKHHVYFLYFFLNFLQKK
jgi:hypothetical protein